MPADKLHITLAGSEHVVEDGTTAGQALADRAQSDRAQSDRAQPDQSQVSQPQTAGTTIAARVNGELRDLAYRLADGDRVEPVAIDEPDGLAILRHSTAHVMAQAVQDLFPEAKLGIGPPIENGFYYDFDVPEPFGPDDLKSIEQKMRQIVKQGQLFSRRVVTDDEARHELAGEPYKLELIGLKGSITGKPGQHRRAVLEGPVPGPAPADHQEHSGLQADAHRWRLLAGERKEPAAPADLRHRMAVP